MHLKHFGRTAASVALACALFAPTAAFASNDPANPTPITPGNSLTQLEGGYQLVVGQATPVGVVPAPMTTTTVWYRGATVVGTSDSYTPVVADRGQQLRRVITYRMNGSVVMTMNQTFTRPVV